jgi:predicted DNA-binding transcriptional regulator YafY
MSDLRRIYRIFQVIARLRSPIGVTKSELAKDYEVDVRTIDRYIELLRDLGFIIVKNHNRFKIERMERDNIRPEDLIVFSLEEADAVKNAMLQYSKVNNLVQKSLLDKLYALTDLDELSDTLANQTVSRNISHLRNAKSKKKQVILKAYRSVGKDESSDRLVEPIRFYNYYRYMVALEVKTKEIKQFKTERIGEVLITNKSFAHERLHSQIDIDIFGMSGVKPIEVELKLSRRASSLLREEFPDSDPFIRKIKGVDVFVGKIYSLEGIGRFVLGLLDEIEVVKPKKLQTYIKDKIKDSGLVELSAESGKSVEEVKEG